MVSKKISRLCWAGIATLGQLIFLPLAGHGAVRPSDRPPDLRGNIVTLLSTSNVNDSITLLIWGKSKPVKTIVNTKTMLECICYHCNIVMSFSISASSARCQMCPCDAANSECTTGDVMKKKGGIEALTTLPKGTQMRAVWEDAAKPESGLLRLIIDRRKILIPVDVDSTAMRVQISDAIKPMGGSHLEIGNDGKVIHITWEEDWSTARSVKLEKILAKWNIHFAFQNDTLAQNDHKTGRQ